LKSGEMAIVLPENGKNAGSRQICALNGSWQTY
jgi:hypothetical protein